MRLVCVPGAGQTTALFATWGALMPDWLSLVPLELPGRGIRIGERPLETMEPLVERLLPDLLALDDQPLTIFGHSLGAKIAFELARRLVAHGRDPVHLFVAACPHDRYPAWGRGLHLRPREELVAQLRRLGTPPLVLRDEELVDLLLPMIRADFQLAAEYDAGTSAPLPCPITAFAGQRDPNITVGDMAAWANHTRVGFRLAVLDADHDVVRERAHELVAAITGALGD
jgi:medium-chain acyl-[acyl-carrier-protein] hydrolase